MNTVTFENNTYTLTQEAFVSDCGEQYQAHATNGDDEFVVYWDVKQFDGGNDDVPEDELCDWENPSKVEAI